MIKLLNIDLITNLQTIIDGYDMRIYFIDRIRKPVNYGIMTDKVLS
jgi:hypothetical protein